MATKNTYLPGAIQTLDSPLNRSCRGHFPECHFEFVVRVFCVHLRHGLVQPRRNRGLLCVGYLCLIRILLIKNYLPWADGFAAELTGVEEVENLREVRPLSVYYQAEAPAGQDPEVQTWNERRRLAW